MKVAQKNSTNTTTVSVALPHPSNIPNVEPSPSGPLVRWIVRYCYSARIKLFRTRKLFGIVQLPRIHNPRMCRMSTTPPAWSFPPPNTLSGNHPEPVFIPGWISAPSIVRYTTLEQRLHFIVMLCFDCYVCFVFIVSSPPFYCLW